MTGIGKVNKEFIQLELENVHPKEYSVRWEVAEKEKQKYYNRLLAEYQLAHIAQIMFAIMF